MERLSMLSGAVRKRAGAMSDSTGARSFSETEGDCVSYAEPRMQEGQCGGDTRYRTGNPTEAHLLNRRFSMRSTGVLFVGWTDGN
jgi:hypothetical protein